MTQPPTDRSSSLRPLLVAFCCLLVAFHLGNAFLGKSLIRASHLGTALEYARGSINLLRPVIIGFNANGAPTAQEFPLWQAAVGLVFKITHSTWVGWANLVSLALFGTALWPFFQLARHYVGCRAAEWATLFFLAQPLIVVMAGEAATDGFCLAVMLWFLFFAEKLIRTGDGRWWWPATLFATLAAVSKLPFFMAAGLCCVLLLLVQGSHSVRLWLLVASAGAVAALVWAAWTHHTNGLAAEAEYPYLDLRMSHSPFLVFWFFGDWHYRLNPANWLKAGWRFLHATLGTLPMVALLVPPLLRRGEHFAKFLLLGTFLTTLVFTHLVLAHWHYYLMCCPAVALLCGATLARWEPFWTTEIRSNCLRLALAGTVLLFSAIDGVLTMKIAIDYDWYPKAMSALVREHTQPRDKLILYTCDPDWGALELLYSGRQGFAVATLESLPSTPTVKGLYDLLANPADLRRLKELGYNKLVVVSESPVRFAVEAINPGNKRHRRFYPSSISPTVDAWPVTYQSEDLLIKQIP